jgi:hypothetical protein
MVYDIDIGQLEATNTSTFPYFIIKVLSLGISPCIIGGARQWEIACSHINWSFP